MDLKPLDPRITQKLLEGHKDTLSPLAAEREAFYSSRTCPTCSGNALQKTCNPQMLFLNGDPIARYQLKCENCGCEFDPHSGIIVTAGVRGMAFEPHVPLIDGPD